ncbi:hypothetical protein F0562_017189 [Nyssa sinensis]|uniref:Uncharacterized protein n=1 Tax=Nyssa sinensis TaxID=561372 RepID=A0A5J4ZEE4_9ASTE|nr:hypothetical protein F0562_017189 [Nyssa sinensis]
MKASLRFREEQKPLFRAKVPLKVLGFPFQSGIVSGESKELSLNLSTFFDSGPSLKFTYRPNDSLNPFSLIFKTGIGHFGSPISSPITMGAEFNLIGKQNPRFFFHFKQPQFGDFTVKKSQSSDFVKCIESKSNGVVSDDDPSVEFIDTPVGKSVRQRAVVNLRWGVRFPAAEEEGWLVAKTNPMARVSSQKFPLLVLNKIGIEHAAGDDSNDRNKVGPSLNSPGNADVAEACFGVKRQLEIIQAENGLLRKAMDDLKSEIGTGKLAFSAGVDRRSNGDKKSSEPDGFGGEKWKGIYTNKEF